MAGLAVLAGLAVRRAAADRRPVVLVMALAAVTLAAARWLAASGVADGDGLTVANDVALIVAAVAVVAGSSPQRWLSGAIHGLVVDLGPSRHPELPRPVPRDAGRQADRHPGPRDRRGHAGVPVQIDLDGPVEGLPPGLRALIYFFCSECLANMAKHAGASAAAVRVNATDGRLTVSVDDDGRGGVSLAGSRGLRGLADRVEVAGGQPVRDQPGWRPEPHQRRGPGCFPPAMMG
jgi:hypothetical protein